jgi:hypothetical protein
MTFRDNFAMQRNVLQAEFLQATIWLSVPMLSLQLAYIYQFDTSRYSRHVVFDSAHFEIYALLPDRSIATTLRPYSIA